SKWRTIRGRQIDRSPDVELVVQNRQQAGFTRPGRCDPDAAEENATSDHTRESAGLNAHGGREDDEGGDRHESKCEAAHEKGRAPLPGPFLLQRGEDQKLIFAPTRIVRGSV